jgi:hypothetical protein
MIELIQAEIDLIQNEKIKEFVTYVFKKAPSYFWENASSSTGKYHCPQNNGHRGLVRHTRGTVYFSLKLCDVYSVEGDYKDAVIASCLLHDIVKYGIQPQKHTTHTHDYDGAMFVHILAKSFDDVPCLDIIKGCIAWHNGKWSRRKNKDDIKKFPSEFSMLEQIVHLSDIMSAQPQVHLLFLDESFLG